MKIAISSLTLILGVALCIYAVISMMSPVAVWSDFMAFRVRVLEIPKSEHFFEVGGENPDENFQDLLDKISALKDSWVNVVFLGFGFSVLDFCGIVIEIKQRNSKNIVETTAVNDDVLL